MTHPGQQPPPYQPAGSPPPAQQPPAYQPPPATAHGSTPPAYAPPPGPAYAPPPGPSYAPPGPGHAPENAPQAGTMGGLNGPVKGKDLLRACWSQLLSDRSLLLLPVMSSVFAAIAMAIFFVPGVIIGLASGSEGGAKFVIYVSALLGGFLASVIGIFFQAALVIGANERADGGDPTVGSTISGAFARIGPILSWAVLTTVVGTIIRAIQQRAGALGSIFGFLGGMAWAIATFLAVPVVVAEGVGPVEAVKRSSAIIKQTWGLGLRSTLRWGLVQLLFVVPPVLVLVLGFVLIGQGGAAAGLGVALAAIALIALVVLGIAFAAVGQYARAMLYRYATGKPVPGLDPQLMAGAFAPKRGRNRFA